MLNAKISWIVMESPSVFVFAIVFFCGEGKSQLVPMMLAGLWLFHYVHRSFVFPLRMRGSGRRDPVFITATSIGFNSMNGALNAYAISFAPRIHDISWLGDPRFLCGGLLFIIGLIINLQSDAILRQLRSPGDEGYRIPNGGLFRFVSCPNYLGEILEWCGWALAAWTFAGLAFVMFTIANLGPRAYAHHKWYLERFPDYPQARSALIPKMF